MLRNKDRMIQICIVKNKSSNLSYSYNTLETIAQWSISLGRGDKTFSKSLEGCLMDMLRMCGWQKNERACMPICVLFLIWSRDPLYYQTFLFLSIFSTFEADLRGLFML